MEYSNLFYSEPPNFWEIKPLKLVANPLIKPLPYNIELQLKLEFVRKQLGEN